MIFNFEKTDPARVRFLDIMNSADVDFEMMENERCVIRVFGHLDAELGRRLQAVYDERRPEAQAADDAENTASTNSHDVFAEFQAAGSLAMIAGPCSVESEEQVAAVVACLQEQKVRFVRGGAFKPRTSPESFQGLGAKGLRILAEHARPAGLKIVTEAMDRCQLDMVCEFADIVQVGSRSMFNYTLLTALGAIDKPVLLKRGMAATIDEWLQAAEYISRGGNDRIIMCERGIRTFEPSTRNTLDIAAIPLVKKQSGLPVVVDPSHAAGDSELVAPLALAAAAAGADGLMVEIHPDPAAALSDSRQALAFDRFAGLLAQLREIRRLESTRAPVLHTSETTQQIRSPQGIRASHGRS